MAPGPARRSPLRPRRAVAQPWRRGTDLERWRLMVTGMASEQVPPADGSDPTPPPSTPPSSGQPRAFDRHRPSAPRPRAADLGGRRLIDLRPDDWLHFVTDRPEARCVERLEGSFQWVGRETDVLLRVEDPEAGEFLVLIELQLRGDPRMAARLQAYAALAEEKFGLPVFVVLLIILPGGGPTDAFYTSTILGQEVRRDFRTLHLWEQDAGAVAQTGAPGLLPLVPVMRGGDDLDLLATVLSRLRQSPEIAGMENLLAYFAGLVLGREAMLNLMRWDMETATGLTFYEEILNEGIEKGIVLGKSQGMERGRETARRFLLHVLTRRFGPQATELSSALAPLDLDSLEGLLVVAEEAPGLDAFRAAVSGLAS